MKLTAAHEISIRASIHLVILVKVVIQQERQIWIPFFKGMTLKARR